MSKYIINEDCRGLLIKNGILEKILKPGKEEISDGIISGNVYKVEIVQLKSSIPVQYLDAILSSEKNLQSNFIIHECESAEAKILIRNKQVLSFVAPNSRAVYFKEVGEVKSYNYDLTKDCKIERTIQNIVTKAINNPDHLININVEKNTRVIVFMDNEIIDILEPGQYSFIKSLNNLEFLKVNNNYFYFNYDLEIDEELFVEQIKSNPKFKSKFTIIETDGETCKIIFVNNKYAGFLKPRLHAIYFEDIGKITTVDFDLSKNLEIPRELYNQIVYAGGSNVQIDEIIVPINYKMILLIDNKFDKILDSGKYYYINVRKNIERYVFPTTLTSIDINGQEVMTQDKVMLRVNISADYAITDPEKVFNVYGYDFKPFIYKELQLRLREAIGTKTLNQTLEEKDAINTILSKKLPNGVEENAITLLNIFIKDVILPGEIRTIMNQVVEAEKKAQANVIKRREETAATRSLLNTAKLMQDNPTLMRLKELETIEKVIENVKELKIYGGIDGVMKNLIKIDGDK
jgi:regulator of protease activity HflC (stomatin/prohibitin superfamily)